MNTNIFRRSVQFYRTIMIRLLIIASLILACLNMEAQGLRVAFIGDPQVDDITELEYARRSIYAELKQRKDLDLIIILGDLVNDKTALIAPSKESLDSLSCPWFAVPGNHDFDVYRGEDKVRDLSTWTDIIGYKDTSFVQCGVRFIMMNNVLYAKNKGYSGRFDKEAMTYIDSLAGISQKDMPIVLATHIPISVMEQKDSIVNIFRNHRKVLYVSGHTHTVSRQNLTEDAAQQELVVGATCGTWWRGTKDAYGIPYALQNCGSPRGYFIADFRKKDCRLTYKAVQYNDNASAYVVTNDDNTGKTLYINIFGGHMSGNPVLPKLGNAPLERVSEPAPEVLKVIAANRSLSSEYKRKRRDEIIPLRRMKSPHLWSVNLPAGYKVPEKILIKYADSDMKFKSRVQVNEFKQVAGSLHP